MTRASKPVTISKTPEQLLEVFPGTPTRLREIAESLGVRSLVRLPNLPVAGLLRSLPDGGFEIHVRSEDSAPRQRFTLAHELAHILIADSGPTGTGSLGCGDPLIERQCDNLAGRLLLPIARYPSRLLVTEPLIAARQAARECQSSRLAAVLRLRDIIPDSVIIAWGTRSRPGAGSKMRVLWSVSNAGTYIPAHAPWPPAAKMPAGSDDIIAEEVRIKLGSVRGTARLDTWRLSDTPQPAARSQPEMLSLLRQEERQ
jgi:hypothetical protein